MKVLGISFGTKKGNNDSLCIEALMAAKAKGAEVEFINMQDLHIEHCTGCTGCVQALLSGKANMCVLKDDFDWLLDKMLSAQGIIITDPIFEEGASGLFHTILDRFGPRMDRGNNMIGRMINEKTGGKPMDPRIIEDRVISYMAVGGSDWGTRAQTEHAMQALTPAWKVIDNAWFPWSAAILLEEDRMNQVRKIGENIAEAAQDIESASYKGEEGVCPHCHNSLFYINNDTQEVVCSQCGIVGDLEKEEGKLKFVFPEEQIELAHDTLSGKFKHGDDIKNKVMAGIGVAKSSPKFIAAKKAHDEFIIPTKPERK